MTPAERARQIEREEFAAESAALRARALAYSAECREREAAKISAVINNGKSRPSFDRKYGRHYKEAKTYTALGFTRTLAQWAEATGIADKTIRFRLNHGWPIERALTTPTQVERAAQKAAKPPKPKRVVRTLTFDGKTMTVAQWAKELNIHRVIIHGRLNDGWPIERALTEPVKAKREQTPRQKPTEKGRLHTFNGESLTLKQWAERTGLKYKTIRTRALRGWSIERILSVPVGSWESAIKCTAGFYTFGGKTMTLLGWSRETGLNKGTLHRRLRRGWSIERTLTTADGRKAETRPC